MKKLSLNALAYNKSTVTELNDSQMNTLKGGSTIVGGETCSGCVCVTVIKTLQKFN